MFLDISLKDLIKATKDTAAFQLARTLRSLGEECYELARKIEFDPIIVFDEGKPKWHYDEWLKGKV